MQTKYCTAAPSRPNAATTASICRPLTESPAGPRGGRGGTVSGSSTTATAALRGVHQGAWEMHSLCTHYDNQIRQGAQITLRAMLFPARTDAPTPSPLKLPRVLFCSISRGSRLCLKPDQAQAHELTGTFDIGTALAGIDTGLLKGCHLPFACSLCSSCLLNHCRTVVSKIVTAPIVNEHELLRTFKVVWRLFRSEPGITAREVP